MNSLMHLWRSVNPSPFIPLNLLLSCLAAIQAPIIMMSQNRQTARERLVEIQEVQLELLSEIGRSR